MLTSYLGSTSVLSDGSGQPAGDRVAYLPYGGVRLGEASTLPTDYTFTGQRLEAGLGLMHYGARFYSPRLGRFVSADTLVPEHGDRQAVQWPLRVGAFKPQDIAHVGEENRQIAQYGFWFQRGPEARQETVRPTGPTNPQELNRYAYCLGNPLRYVDPSGEQVEVFVALLVVIVFLEVGVPVIYGLSEEFSDHDEPHAAPEPSPTRTPWVTPPGGDTWEIKSSRFQEGSCPVPTPTNIWDGIPSLPLATRIPEQYIGPMPTATATPHHLPAEDAFHLLHGIDLQHDPVEEERILIPESIYEPKIWIYDPISGQRTPR